MREDRCQLCEKQIKWLRPGCGEGRALVSSWSRTGSSRGGQISAILQAGPCQARLQRLLAPTPEAQFLEAGAFAGQQAPAPRSHAKDMCSALPEPCQVPQKGRTDAGRGREPAARVQPCTAIIVLLIPRGFRMSEPHVPCRGQLGWGRAAIPAHVVDAPRCSLLRLAQGGKTLLLCQAMDRPHGHPRICLLPDTLPALKRLLPARDGHVPARPRGRGCPLQLPAMGSPGTM